MSKGRFPFPRNPFKRPSAPPPPAPTLLGERPKTVRDRHGRELLEGDELIMPALKLEAPVFVVAGISPLVDPQAPPNLMRVTLLTTVMIGVKADTADQSLIKTRDRTEVGPVPGVQYPAEALAALGWTGGGGQSAAPESSDPDGSADVPSSPRTPATPADQSSTGGRGHSRGEGLGEGSGTAGPDRSTGAWDAPLDRAEEPSPLAEATTRLVLP